MARAPDPPGSSSPPDVLDELAGAATGSARGGPSSRCWCSRSARWCGRSGAAARTAGRGRCGRLPASGCSRPWVRGEHRRGLRARRGCRPRGPVQLGRSATAPDGARDRRHARRRGSSRVEAVTSRHPQRTACRTTASPGSTRPPGYPDAARPGTRSSTSCTAARRGRRLVRGRQRPARDGRAARARAGGADDRRRRGRQRHRTRARRTPSASTRRRAGRRSRPTCPRR